MSVVRNIYNWMYQYYTLRYSNSAPFSWEFKVKERLVEKNSSRSYQGVNDCFLHTAIVPVLIADNRQINILGNTPSERKQAGTEMRRRMIVQLESGEFMFSEVGRGKMSLKISNTKEIKKNTKMEDIEKTRKSLSITASSQKKTRQKNNNLKNKIEICQSSVDSKLFF